MPNRPPKHCRHCGGHERDVGAVSWRGRCAGCGDTRLVENNRQIGAHSGPWFDHWRRQSAAALGIFLPAPAEPESALDTSDRAA